MFKIEDFKEKYQSGAYKNQMPQPSLQKMQRGRNGINPDIEAAIDEHNARVDAEKSAYVSETRRLQGLEYQELLLSLQNEYNWNANQAEKAYNFAASQKDAGVIGNLEFIEDMMDFYESLT